MAEKIKSDRERSWGVTLQEVEKWGQVQAEGINSILGKRQRLVFGKL